MLTYYEDILNRGLTLLNFAGLHPAKPSIKRRILVSLPVVFYTGLVVLGFVIEENNFENMVGLVFSVCAINHILAQLVTAILKARDLEVLLKSIDNFWPIFLEGKPGETQRLSRSLKRFRLILNSIIAYEQFAVILNIIVVLLTKSHLFKYFIPEAMSLEVSIATETFFLQSGLLVVIGFDLLFTGLLFLMSLQFKLLNESFANLDFDKPNSEKWYNCRIKNYALHHTFLLQQANSLNNIFGPMLLALLWNLVILLCFMGYMAMVQYGDATTILRNVIYLSAVASESFIFYFWPSQWLTNEASKTVENIYSSNWYLCPYPSVIKSLVIMLTKAQEDTVISAGGLMLMNLETGTNILKSSYSFCMFANRMRTKLSGTN